MYLEFFVQFEHVLLMVAPEDHIQEVVVLDILDPVRRCVFTLISVETKAWTDFPVSLLIPTHSQHIFD